MKRPEQPKPAPTPLDLLDDFEYEEDKQRATALLFVKMLWPEIAPQSCMYFAQWIVQQANDEGEQCAEVSS